MIAHPRDVIGYVDVHPGLAVGDFGVGSGAFGELVVPHLNPGGKYYAFDAIPHLLAKAKKIAAAHGVSCFTLHADFEDALPLAENILDLGLLANTLSSVPPTSRQQFIHELSRVIKPKGSILYVDWMTSPKDVGPARPLLVSPADAARLFKAAAFDVSAILPAGHHQYAFVATLK
ncbi:MAG: class I SAM-dependent methyltransferase [Patescibacteria group bacterium]